jgi:hypothetical protein
LKAAADSAGLADHPGIRILIEDRVEAYFDRFHECLGTSHVLFTKPSEMTFFGALGLPLLLAPPVGVHEIYNARWAVEAGAAFWPRELDALGGWLEEWLAEGVLARAAWDGFQHLETRGVYRIASLVAGQKFAETDLAG